MEDFSELPKEAIEGGDGPRRPMVLKVYISSASNEGIRLAISSIYETGRSRSMISAIMGAYFFKTKSSRYSSS